MAYKAKITIVVEFDSEEYDNPETMLDEIGSESYYEINSTPNVDVLNTELRAVELI